MAKKNLSYLEYNLQRLIKYTNILRSLSTFALILGIFIGAIMVLTASGIMFEMFVAIGVFILIMSITYYWTSQYFIYMGRGMVSLLNELLTQREKKQSEESPSET